jgi:hypothetical protein
MPYCPNCGQKLPDGARYCDGCGEALIHLDKAEAQKSLLEHMHGAARLTLNNPVIFIPEALGGAFGMTMGRAFTALGEFFDLESLYEYIYPQLSTAAYTVQDVQDYPLGFWMFGLSSLLLLLAYSAVSGLFTFATVHMVWTGIKTGSVSMGGSARYVLGRFWVLLLAVVLGDILSLTLVLAPAVFFMYAAMVVDGAGVRDGLSKAFAVTMKRLGASIAIVVVYVALQLAFGYIPYIGSILFAVPATIMLTTVIDLYAASK